MESVKHDSELINPSPEVDQSREVSMKMELSIGNRKFAVEYDGTDVTMTGKAYPQQLTVVHELISILKRFKRAD